MRTASALLLLGLLVGATVARATSAEPRLEPSAPGLGEPARLRLEAAPADSSRWPRGLGVEVEPTDDPTVFRVLPLRVGEVGIIAPGWADTLAWTVPGRVQAPDPESLRPLRSQGEVGPVWWPHLLLGGLLAALLAWLLYQRLRRRGAAIEIYEPPTEPPHRRALRRLDALAGGSLLEKGDFESWYVEGSHALREYVGGRYRVPALDWTRGELLTRLVEAGFEKRNLEEIDPLLDEADGVKFAGRRPTVHQAERWLRSIRAFVEATAIERVYSTPEALAAARRMNEGVVR